MQWWWPDDKPENTNCVWAEIAIRLLDPSADDAEMQVWPEAGRSVQIKHVMVDSPMA